MRGITVGMCAGGNCIERHKIPKAINQDVIDVMVGFIIFLLHGSAWKSLRKAKKPPEKPFLFFHLRPFTPFKPLARP